MKAKDYAKSFLNGRKEGEDPNALLLIIFRDMIREANLIVEKNKLDNILEISSVFEMQAIKWEKMCGILKRYPIAKNGFRALLKAKAPQSYYKLVASRMKPMEEDLQESKNNGKIPKGGNNE